MSKEKIIKYLLKYCDDKYDDRKFNTVNEENWTIADLFIRQYLNNGCDGFGMENVAKVYEYLVKHKEELIEYNLLSKEGTNNFGFTLWNDYDIGWSLEGRTLQGPLHRGIETVVEILEEEE